MVSLLLTFLAATIFGNIGLSESWALDKACLLQAMRFTAEAMYHGQSACHVFVSDAHKKGGKAHVMFSFRTTHIKRGCNCQ